MGSWCEKGTIFGAQGMTFYPGWYLEADHFRMCCYVGGQDQVSEVNPAQ